MAQLGQISSRRHHCCHSPDGKACELSSTAADEGDALGEDTAEGAFVDFKLARQLTQLLIDRMHGAACMRSSRVRPCCAVSLPGDGFAAALGLEPAARFDVADQMGLDSFSADGSGLATLVHSEGGEGADWGGRQRRLQAATAASSCIGNTFTVVSVRSVHTYPGTLQLSNARSSSRRAPVRDIGHAELYFAFAVARSLSPRGPCHGCR